MRPLTVRRLASGLANAPMTSMSARARRLRAGDLLKPFVSKVGAKSVVPVVTDANVAGTSIFSRCWTMLGKAGIATRPVVMAPGEDEQKLRRS